MASLQMLVYPDIDPIAFRAFGFPVRWYGLMYLFALGLALAWGRRALARKPMFADAGIAQIVDFVTAAALGVIIGGRLGYALLYKAGDYVHDPLSVLYLWQGGMSFHGGLVGAIVAVAIYARRARAPFLRLTDLAVLLAPPGLGLGRIGNFIGGELPGRIASADLPWAMIYGHIDNMPRHPSQLYQAFLEGVVLTILMVLLSRKWRPAGWLSAMFLISYGALRFISEFFREPDAHLGLQLFDLSRGQWLCVPMIIVGALMLLWLPGGKKAARTTKSAKRKRSKGKGIGKFLIAGAGLLIDLLAVFGIVIIGSGRGFAKKTKENVAVANAAAADDATMITAMEKPNAAAEVAAAAKPSFALTFALAAGGYVGNLPGRFWSYMRNDEPEVAEVQTEEYAEEEEKADGEADGKKGVLWNFFFDGNEPAEKADG
ncbi:MAG: prolipoprotein diacylglyceryl transferase, partial [Gammaproteobacteria bacterium]